jgi:hypothetical protein
LTRGFWAKFAKNSFWGDFGYGKSRSLRDDNQKDCMGQGCLAPKRMGWVSRSLGVAATGRLGFE